MMTKRLCLYIIITFILTWLFWLPGFDVAQGAVPDELLSKIGDFMPSVMALVFIACTASGSGFKSLIDRLVHFRFKPRWYLYSILTMPLIVGVAYLSAHCLFGQKFNSVLVPIIAPQIWPALPLILYFIVVQGPLGEELGWRGYVLPMLLEKFTPVKTSILLGLIWSVWHYPKFFISNTIQASLADAYGLVIALAGFSLYTIILTFLITFLYLKTNGSIFGAMLFHAMANYSHGLITILIQPAGGAAILTIMLIWGIALNIRFKKELNEQILVE